MTVSELIQALTERAPNGAVWVSHMRPLSNGTAMRENFEVTGVRSDGQLIFLDVQEG